MAPSLLDHPTPAITLTTDFGRDSLYVAQMKGAVLAINPAAVLVDVTHSISPQGVRQGAIVLERMMTAFPPGAIHVAVVDPGVGTDREIICMEAAEQLFIGPDNGVLSRVAKSYPPARVVTISDRKFWRQSVSNTFHGRDIMAPVAAHLSLGAAMDQLGPARQDWLKLDWPEVRRTDEGLAGAVEWIDSFGNLVTNITSEELSILGGDLTFSIADQSVTGLSQTYGDRPQDQLVALIGSSGKLEISVVGGNAAARMGVEEGEEIMVNEQSR